jgi:O-antigen/teichoic acid export membrane protein
MIASTASVAVLNYSLNVFLGWSLPVEAYGQIGVTQTLIFVGVWFLGAGFPWVVARAIAQSGGARSMDSATSAWRTFKTAWVANAALTLVVVALLLVPFERGWLALGPGYGPLIVMAAITIAALGIGAVPAAALQGLHRFGLLSIDRFGEAALNLVLSFVLVVLGFGAPGALAGFALAAVFLCVLSIWQIRDQPFWRAPGWGGLAATRAALPMTVAVFGGVLLTNIDLLAIKFLSPAAGSDALAGAYQVAAILGRAPPLIATALINVFYPRIAAEARTGNRAVCELLRWVGLTVLPLNVIMAVGAQAVILFFFPETYASASLTLSILAVGSAFLAWATALAAIGQARGETRTPALVMGAAVVLQVACLYVLVPPFGMLGAALSSAGASVVACCVLMGLSRGRGVAVAPPPRLAAALVLVGVLAVPLATLLARADRVVVAVWVAISLAGYGIGCLFFKAIPLEVLQAFVVASGSPNRTARAAELLVGAAYHVQALGHRTERVLFGPKSHLARLLTHLTLFVMCACVLAPNIPNPTPRPTDRAFGPATAAAEPSSGLLAQYFNATTTLEARPAITMIVDDVDFDWQNADTFSARFIGSITPSYSENYTFTLTHDNGLRLWVNGQRILEDAVDGPESDTRSSPILLAANQAYPIVVEYYHKATQRHEARLALTWRSASQDQETVPSSHLTPSDPQSAPERLSSPDQFVTTCGQSLCANGRQFQLYGASIYGQLPNMRQAISLTGAANLNTLRIVNFLDDSDDITGQDESRWKLVDSAIAAAQKANLKVILDLSTYAGVLYLKQTNPYTHDWNGFVQFVANRHNTVSGLVYKNDPTIVFISLSGEVVAPNYQNNPLHVTTSQLNDFFGRTSAELRAVDPNHLISSGGLINLGEDSGIEWRTIFAQPAIDVCSIHIYSDADRLGAAANVSSYCAAIDKPWITEEFGWNQKVGDQQRANNFQAVYSTQKELGGAGIAFWNLDAGVGDTFGVSSATPLTLAVVRQNAPPPTT